MSNTFAPGPAPNTVRSADGSVLNVPEGWALLPPGDAALTRRVKQAGEPVGDDCPLYQASRENTENC